MRAAGTAQAGVTAGPSRRENDDQTPAPTQTPHHEPEEQRCPDQEHRPARALAEAVFVMGAPYACTAITAPRPIIRMLRMVGK